MSLNHTKNRVALTALVAALALSGCSGSKEGEDGLETKAEGEGEGGGEANEAPSDASGEDTGESMAAGMDPSTSMTPAPEPTPAPAAAGLTGMGGAPATPAPAPTAAPAPDANRVVRYVKDLEAPLRGTPSDAAPPVGKLVKGDKILVVIENGWGRVGTDLFIKAEALSPKAVAPDRAPATWIKPAH